ncbi:hypothetical protein OIO90_001740 [Microbotryomycetes sp. JL221]|nr:hypothetical protein OIO90_001740 [Microbotryomycetes sp. JL221]
MTARTRDDGQIDLSPLAFLHQVVHTVTLDEAFIVMADLHRVAGPDNALEWTVGVALGSQRHRIANQTEFVVQNAESRGPSRQESWWGASWSAQQLTRLFTIPGSAIAPEDVPQRLVARFNTGHLHVPDPPQSAHEILKALTLEIHLTDTLKIDLKLEPCSVPPVSAVHFLARCKLSSTQEALKAAQSNSSQGGLNQRGSQTSPKKVNAALMRKRQQVRVQTDDFQPISDSD